MTLQLRPGGLLLSHPVHGPLDRNEQVVLVTESNPRSTTGLILNDLSNHNLRALLEDKGINWYEDNNLYIGGPHNPNALVMLHTDEWYSENTSYIDNHLSMSSDRFMMEKLEAGNSPDWYRLFVGFEVWDAQDIEHQLRTRKPEWLFLPKPSQVLIELADEELWHNAVAEYSQDVFDTYF